MLKNHPNYNTKCLLLEAPEGGISILGFCYAPRETD